jgi:hypothetical protein
MRDHSLTNSNMSYSSQQASDFQSKLKRVDQNTSQSDDQHGYTHQSQTSHVKDELGHSRPSQGSTTASSSRTIKRLRDESTTRSHARRMLNPPTRASKVANQSLSDMMDFEIHELAIGLARPECEARAPRHDTIREPVGHLREERSG